MANRSIRSDFPLIRHLSRRWGNEVAMGWQRLPLIQLAGETLRTEMEGKLLSESFKNLPFEDFVFDLDGTGFGISMKLAEVGQTSNIRLVHYWFRLSKAKTYLANAKKLSPWFKSENFGAGPGTGDMVVPDLYLEVWLDDPYVRKVKGEELGLICKNPEITGIQLNPFRYQHNFSTDDMRMFNRVTGTETKKILEEYRNHLIMSAILASHMNMTQEYMVELRPEVVLPRRNGAKDKKPWTYEYLPRIILIDPNKPSPHFPPVEAVNTIGTVAATVGTHATPRPHQRRGHYRKYKSDRFRYMKGKTVFVKPSWIGPEQWIKEGQVYKVLGANQP